MAAVIHFTFKTDALVSSHEDAQTQVICSDNFSQSGVLGVAETQTTQFCWHLQTKSTQFAHALEIGIHRLCILNRIF